MERIAKWGWPNVLRLAGGGAELLVTLDVGPRVLSYRRDDGPNVFKVFDAQLGGTGEPDWQVRGGHRLWTSPEDLTRTYAPDNSPVSAVEVPGGVRLTTHDAAHGIQKEIELTLGPSGGVRLLHRITNTADAPARLAAWALTVLAPGGVEIIPLPDKRPHPGPPSNAKSPDDYAPNQTMVLWPFFDFTDPRWTFGRRFLLLRHDGSRGPTKLGLLHREGWVAYNVAGQLFVKRFGSVDKAEYPDRGCNFETFTNEDMLEAESLSPLVTLPPGGAVEHREEWELHALAGEVRTEDDAQRLVTPLARG